MPAARALAALAPLLAACAALDPLTASSPWRDDLVTLERALGAAPVPYAADERAGPFDPEGLYAEGDTVWAWSRAHVEQVGLILAGHAPRELRPAARRRGPLATTRCVAGDGRLAGRTFCVGERERGGLVTFPAAGFAAALPARGGFRDLALDGRRGRVHVLDGVEDRVWTLDAAGAALSTSPAPPAAYRLGLLGDDALWVLSGAAPRLAALPLDADGRPGPAVAAPRVAPARDAAWDPERGLLWLVGPEDAAPRRDTGPVRHLRAALTGHRAADLLAGRAAPAVAVDLGAAGLVDATAALPLGGAVAVSASGSDRVALVHLDGPAPRVEAVAAGLHPRGLLRRGAALLVAARHDDAVVALALAPGEGGARPAGRAVLSDAPRDGPRDLGERLFYGPGPWRADPGDALTCNTCHWDTRTDHRLQPGFLERRQEITRPLGGIGAVLPIFSTGGAPTLADALEGLFRGLDARMWRRPRPRGRWWDAPVRVAVKGGGTRTLGPGEARAALLTFLASLPAEPGPLRPAGAPLSPEAREGWALFARDCASCHEPVPSLRRRDRVPDADVPAALAREALVFGAAAWAHTGVEPAFHANGTRVSPLRDLGRGGPFLTNGSAATLDDLLARARPHTRPVHGGRPGHPPAYTPAQRAALRAFLLSL